MPFQKGRQKTGGRAPKALNPRDKAKSRSLAELVADCVRRMAMPPWVVLARIAEGDLPCGTCHGKGVTRYQPGTDKTFERVCESCYGSKKERISTADRRGAAGELMRYVVPQKKAVEVSGPDAGPVQSSVTVRIVDSPSTPGENTPLPPSQARQD